MECGAEQTHRVCKVCFDRDQVDVGTTRWWGQTWKAPVNHPDAQIPVPIGAMCSGRCGEKIKDGDRGLSIPSIESEHLIVMAQAGAMVQVGYTAYHRDCFLAMLGLDPA